MRLHVRLIVRLGAVLAFVVAPVPGIAQAQPVPPADPAATIVVVGAVNGVVTVTSNTPFPDVVLALRSTGVPRSPTAEVSAFSGPAGEVVPATVDPLTFVGSNATLRIKTELPFGGPYTAQLTLKQEGAPDQNVEVSVTRTPTPAAVTIDGVATVAIRSAGVGRTTVVRRLALTETAGRGLELQAPVVVTGSRTVASQVELADIRVQDLIADSTTCTVKDRKVTLLASQPCSLVLTLEVPAAPAVYQATVRFGVVGHTAIDDQLTIQAKRSWWVALIVFALGVGVGGAVLRVLRPAQDRLRPRIEVARIRRNLDLAVSRLGTLDVPVQQAADELSRFLGDLDDMARDQPSEVTARVQIVSIQVGVFRAWADLHRALVAADPSVRKKLQPTLDEIAADMQDRTLDETRAGELLGRLQQLRTDLDGQTLGLLHARADDLRAQAPGLGLALGGSKLDIALTGARAATTIDEAAREMATADQLVAEEMGARITTVTSQDKAALKLPMDEADWNDLRADVDARVQAAMDAPAEERISQLREADLALVKGVAAACIADLEPKRRAWATSGAPNLEQLVRWPHTLTGLTTRRRTSLGVVTVDLTLDLDIGRGRGVWRGWRNRSGHDDCPITRVSG